MGPAGLYFYENGIEDKSAVIIERGDEISFLLGCGCPEMVGGIMLDEFPYVIGQDLSVMETLFWFSEIEAMAFCSANNGGQGDFLAIFLFQPVLDIAVVVGF